MTAVVSRDYERCQRGQHACATVARGPEGFVWACMRCGRVRHDSLAGASVQRLGLRPMRVVMADDPYPESVIGVLTTAHPGMLFVHTSSGRYYHWTMAVVEAYAAGVPIDYY